MATKERKPRSDFNTTVHALFERIAAGDEPPGVEAKREAEQAEQEAAQEAAKDPEAVARGRAGGKKGGKARQAQLTAEERRKLGQTAAAARWGSKAG